MDPPSLAPATLRRGPLTTMRMAYGLLTPPERRAGTRVLGIVLAAAAFEFLGIGSLFPFLSILMEPAVIFQNPATRWAYSALGFRSTFDFLLAAGVAVLAVTVLANVLAALSNRAQARFVARVNHGLSVRLMEAYLRRPYAFFLQRHSADLNKRILDDSSKVVYGVFSPALVLVSRGAVALAVVAVLLWVEPLATALLLGAFTVVYGGLYARLQRRLVALGRRGVEANEARFRTASEAFGGIKGVKATGSEGFFVRRFAAASHEMVDSNARYTVQAQLPRFLVQTLVGVGMMGILLLKLASGEPVEAIVPVVGVFAFAGYRMMPAFQEVLNALTSFRYFDLMFTQLHAELTSAPSPEPGPVEPMRLRENIRFEDVTFRYEGAAAPSLRGVSLAIPKGASVAFVGATGAGKSTLVDVALGLLHPQEGRVLVDGQPLEPSRAAAWRRNVGYVPQDIFLTDDTAAGNIAFGVPPAEVDRARVERAARVAHVHDVLEALPRGYDTPVGERGVRLSGGQRQRLGIARALYHDPEVLVLDEATSDIDNITQGHIARAIEELAGTKTLLVVAHRLETVRRCDRVFLLDRGEVVAQGTFQELLAASPAFRELAAGLDAPPVTPVAPVAG